MRNIEIRNLDKLGQPEVLVDGVPLRAVELIGVKVEPCYMGPNGRLSIEVVGYINPFVPIVAEKIGEGA